MPILNFFSKAISDSNESLRDLNTARRNLEVLGRRDVDRMTRLIADTERECRTLRSLVGSLKPGPNKTAKMAALRDAERQFGETKRTCSEADRKFRAQMHKIATCQTRVRSNLSNAQAKHRETLRKINETDAQLRRARAAAEAARVAGANPNGRRPGRQGRR